MANGRKQKNKRVRVKRVRVPAGVLDARARAYRQLLLDPCNGPLVGPPVSGPTTGLYVRQRYLKPISGSIGTLTPRMSFLAMLRPSNAELVVSTGKSGEANVVTYSLEEGLLTSSTCSSYRPVAACMKFVPTGSIGNRSGVLGAGYIPELTDNPTVGTWTNAMALNYVTMAQRTSSNTGASLNQEVKWFPSGPDDLDFRPIGSSASEVGAVFIAGSNIDTDETRTSGGTAVNITINGYIDVTVVWEWTPKYSAGITTSVQAGSTSTLQQVLATLGDLGRFAVNSEMGQRAMRGIAQGSMAYMAQRAVDYMAGPAMLMG